MTGVIGILLALLAAYLSKGFAGAIVDMVFWSMVLIGISVSNFAAAAGLAVATSTIIFYIAWRRYQELPSMEEGVWSAAATASAAWQTWDGRLASLSGRVTDELTALYKQKVSPTVRNIDIRIDFADVVRTAGGKGIALSVIKCPSCNANVSLPENGDTVKCLYCGAVIKATDILDRMLKG